jgi:hypothetical protein
VWIWKIPVTVAMIPASTCQKIKLVSMGSIAKLMYITIKIPIRATISELAIKIMFQNNLKLLVDMVLSVLRK